MKISKLIVLGLLLVVMACSNEKETPKGYKYTVITKGDGKLPKPGDWLQINMTLKDDKDSVWNDSKSREVPLFMPVAPATEIANEAGIEEMLRLISKGDSVFIRVPAKTFFEKSIRQPMPPMIDSTRSFTLNIGVVDVLDSAQFEKWKQDYIAGQNAKAMKQAEEQLAKDTAAIDNYLKEKGITAKKTPSGLRYIVTKEGKGANAAQGQTVKLEYKGYLLNGKVFDTSSEAVAKANNVYQEGRPYSALELQAGTGQVIPGWEEAMLLMSKGSKITVWIPSSLAYGAQRRSEDIVENTILAFDMEMVDIK